MASSSPATSGNATVPANPALAGWFERAESTAVPVFSATVSEVTSIVDSARSSAQDLAAAIGHDAALTAKLLRLANSPLFRRRGPAATTIGSAVVLIGFNAVRDLAITLSIIERVQSGPDNAPLIDTMLRAFHCAGQSRQLAHRQADRAPEELFLAGLLSRLGELVFWASGTREVPLLAARWSDNAPDEAVQQEVLGFTLRELTLHLVQVWHMGKLLQSVVGRSIEEPRIAAAQLAHNIAGSGTTSRWRDLTTETLAAAPEMKTLVERHADLLGQTAAASLEQIRTEADKAGQLARRFGVSAIEPPARSVPRKSDDAKIKATDPVRQLAILGEMTAAMQGPATLDQLMRLALRGIVESAGFDRVFFALLSPDRKVLSVKHRVGAFEMLPGVLPLSSNAELSEALVHSGAAIHEISFTLKGQTDWKTPVSSLTQAVLAGHVPIGVLYADCIQAEPEIAPESVAALQLFLQQLSLGIKGIS